VTIIALPLLFPLLIGGFITSRINSRQFTQQYSEFLRDCDNVIFFCYTNRNQTHSYIEENILPHLNPTLNVIYWEGREVHSDFEPRFLTHMLYHLHNTGFPNLMRVTNRQVIDMSLQNDLQLVLDQAGEPASFVKLVHDKVEVLQSAEASQSDKQPKRSRASLKRQGKG